MVFYRKYRPQNLDELYGQESVKQTLLKAFLGGKLAHAYLFTGPRGTGKTSTARILAKMVNCEESYKATKLQSYERSLRSHDLKAEGSIARSLDSSMTIPCNNCDSCKSITDGSNLDLIEIDAASNRGIDDIRELRDKVKLSPSMAKKKVYIIDEVHMLTTEAFNALLKTLEEPPEHVMFILATTELNKVPQTILSRVQKLQFQLADSSEIKKSLEKIIKEEKIEIDDEALELLIKKGEGSFRDTQKMLDQLASIGEPITKEVIETSIRSSSSQSISELVKLLLQKDQPAALKLILGEINNGTSPKELLVETLEFVRNLILTKHNPTVAIETTKIKLLAEKYETIELIRLINLLQQASEKLRFSLIASLPLEIAVIEYCLTSPVVVTPQPEIVSSPAPKVVINDTLNLALQSPQPVVAESFTGSDDSSDKAKLVDKWAFVLETIKPYNYSLEALLKQAKIISCEGGVVVLEVPYSFHQRIIESQKSKTILESVLADILGKTVQISTSLGSRPVRIEELANVEVAADDEIIKIASEIFNS